MTNPMWLQLSLDLGVPVEGVVAVPAPVENRVVRREVGRVVLGAGLGTFALQHSTLSEPIPEHLPPVVSRILRL